MSASVDGCKGWEMFNFWAIKVYISQSGFSRAESASQWNCVWGRVFSSSYPCMIGPAWEENWVKNSNRDTTLSLGGSSRVVESGTTVFVDSSDMSLTNEPSQAGVWNSVGSTDCSPTIRANSGLARTRCPFIQFPCYFSIEHSYQLAGQLKK